MITLPPLTDVSPGDPITSEGWNNVLDAARTIATYLNTQRGTLTIQVRNQADGNPVRNALVTVSPTGDPAGRPTRTALFAAGSVGAHQVDQLLPGGYDVLVEADGFNPETRSITMPDTGEPFTVSVDMAVTQALLPAPNLFGQQVTQALANLTAQGFSVARLIDAHGNDIALGSIPDDSKTAWVLGQWPFAGALVPAATQFFLHASSKAEYLQRVSVPDIRGLSLEDARTLLEAHGLTLGTSTSVGI
jgi:hypothetical protein